MDEKVPEPWKYEHKRAGNMKFKQTKIFILGQSPCAHILLLQHKRSFPCRTRARICKRLWSPGIDFANLCSLTGRYENRVVVPARQAGNRFLVSLKGLQIRALVVWNTVQKPGLCKCTVQYTAQCAVLKVLWKYLNNREANFHRHEILAKATLFSIEI